MKTKKNFFIAVLLFIVAMLCATTAQAQQRVNHVSYTGRHCLLVETRGSANLDKAPLTGKSQIEAGGFLRLMLFKKSFYAFAEGGYQRSDFAGYVGGGVKLAKDKWAVKPALELGIGLGNQTVGYNYEGSSYEDNASGKVSVNLGRQFLDNKIKLQGRAAFTLEFRCDDRWSVVASAETIYRPYEAKTLDPSGEFKVNNKPIDPSVGAIKLRSEKLVYGVSLGIRFRIL